MEQAVITKKLRDGSTLEARFLPEKGMNLASLRWNDIEIIDQSTQPLFEERYAGLGAMIGPHFHRRYDKALPQLEVEDKFPHIARVKANGVQEPFSHGIGRYAPWNAVLAPSSIEATLTGKEEWNGVPLAQLEGQDFKMWYNAEIDDTGLNIEMAVISDTDSLMGIHYCYRVPQGNAHVHADVKDHYLDQGERKAIPDTWTYGSRGELEYDLSQPADYTFQPHLNPVGGSIQLNTTEYSLKTTFRSPSEELCWQLYRPEAASFVCIEPMSAANPRKPQLSVSRLFIHLEVAAP